MRKINSRSPGWNVKALDPPILTQTEWVICSLLGAVLIVMALLQLISFGEFSNILYSHGLPAATVWAIGVILAELWAAAGFFRLRLSYLFRAVSGSLALLVAGFWFLISAQSLAVGDKFSSIGMLGNMVKQRPGLLTVCLSAVFLVWTMYAAALTRYTLVAPRKK